MQLNDFFAIVSKITLKWGYESFKLCIQWGGEVVESLSIKIHEKGEDCNFISVQ